MRKLIVFILIVVFISQFDLSKMVVNLKNNFLNVNTLLKNINMNDQTAKNIINYVRDPDDFLTDIIDRDFEKLHQELNTLESEYYQKLLIEYNIDQTELNNVLNKTEKNKDLVKKQYIMEKTHLSELEYYQIFVFPFNKIDKPEIEDDLSFTEFKDNYEQYLIDSINYFEDQLED